LMVSGIMISVESFVFPSRLYASAVTLLLVFFIPTRDEP
jgi:hypothetical protein